MNAWSGHNIARWFTANVALDYQRAQTAEGFDLEMDDDGYCYVWVTAFVDLDADAFWLLDVRTKNGTDDETRDFLFVGRGVTFGKSFPQEWQQKPTKFGAEADTHRERLREGLEWFAGRIEFWTEDHAFAGVHGNGEDA